MRSLSKIKFYYNLYAKTTIRDNSKFERFGKFLLNPLNYALGGRKIVQLNPNGVGFDSQDIKYGRNDRVIIWFFDGVIILLTLPLIVAGSAIVLTSVLLDKQSRNNYTRYIREYKTNEFKRHKSLRLRQESFAVDDSQVQAGDFFSNLPAELRAMLLPYLDVRSLSALARVSKTWNNQVNDSMLDLFPSKIIQLFDADKFRQMMFTPILSLPHFHYADGGYQRFGDDKIYANAVEMLSPNDLIIPHLQKLPGETDLLRWGVDDQRRFFIAISFTFMELYNGVLVLYQTGTEKTSPWAMVETQGTKYIFDILGAVNPKVVFDYVKRLISGAAVGTTKPTALALAVAAGQAINAVANQVQGGQVGQFVAGMVGAPLLAQGAMPLGAQQQAPQANAQPAVARPVMGFVESLSKTKHDRPVSVILLNRVGVANRSYDFNRILNFRRGNQNLIVYES